MCAHQSRRLQVVPPLLEIGRRPPRAAACSRPSSAWFPPPVEQIRRRASSRPWISSSAFCGRSANLPRTPRIACDAGTRIGSWRSQNRGDTRRAHSRRARDARFADNTGSFRTRAVSGLRDRQGDAQAPRADRDGTRMGRMEWSVLDWNTSAQDFYGAQGARPMDDWTMWRLTGEAPVNAARK
jgi:hypothetical protein